MGNRRTFLKSAAAGVAATPAQARSRCALALALLVVAASCRGPSSADSAEALEEIAKDYFAYGEAVADSFKLSPKATEETASFAREILERLDALPLEVMTHEQQLTAEILRWRASDDVREPDLYWYRSPITPYSSPLGDALTRLNGKELKSASDLEAYVASVQRFARLLTAVHEKLRVKVERGIVLPTPQIGPSTDYVESFTARAAQSALAVAPARLGAIPVDQAEHFQHRLAAVIDSSVVPAARSLTRYVADTLRRKAPPDVGISQYPGGKEIYRTLVKQRVTLDITPEEVHQHGLDGLERIEAEMQQIRDSLGFRGTQAEFHQRLRRDPRFHVKTPEEFGQRLMAHFERILPMVDQYFLRSPRAKGDVRRLDPALEGTMTYGYYQRPTDSDSMGHYLFNGSELERRSLLSSAGLTYHELVPGHHFQINLALENEAVPEFRRRGYYSGFGEGWGEYSSSVVAREMGMYQDLYDLYGRLVFDAFFAVRLVVDTGMNYYGWPRAKALAFMKDHTMESEVQIASETLRYSTDMPAQALAYRMGRETFLRLRRQAEEELGERFDVRRFHDAAIGSGAMPLAILERHIAWFIAQEKTRQD